MTTPCLCTHADTWHTAEPSPVWRGRCLYANDDGEPCDCARFRKAEIGRLL